MSKDDTGVYQLKNGYWEYRISITVNGKRKNKKSTTDEQGKRLKTKKQAIQARQNALFKLKNPPCISISRKTYGEVFSEYCNVGRKGKAYSTIRKQDSLWQNHLETLFSERYVDEVSVAEINDYLTKLYYIDGYSYSYTESFLKMFYLILGQAYSRNYLDSFTYDKLCRNKNTKIHMPKMKVDDEEDDVVVYSIEEMHQLDAYFKGRNIETAFFLGKYCGLRISECFGLKWNDVDLKNRKIHINRQMQYIDGIIKLVPLKTRNAKRTIYLSDAIYKHLLEKEKNRIESDIRLNEVRNQKQVFIKDLDGSFISSLELVNTLPNGKLQTSNSVKYHARQIKECYGFHFKYHYLRHTYGTRLAEMNTPIHLLCNQMGHASSKVTERYYLAITKSSVQLLTENLNQL